MPQPPDKQKQTHVIHSLINITKALAGIVVLLIAGIILLAYGLTADIAGPIASTQPKAAPPQSAATHSQTTAPPAAPAGPQIADGKDMQTGLLAGEGLAVVKTTCTACHSSDLILQNRFTREGWHEKIVWMQQTQGLWDLGESEAVILDYLAANYAPEAFRGRRKPLNVIEWYELKD